MPTNLYYLVSGDVSEQGGGQRLMTKLDPPLSPFTPVRGQSIPFWCRRKVYRWEICFSQSALRSVQPSFLSFPAYQISNITHDLTDN